MKLTFKRWVHNREKQVIAELVNMGLETDVIITLTKNKQNSNDMRVASELGYDPFAIANELASRVSN